MEIGGRVDATPLAFGMAAHVAEEGFPGPEHFAALGARARDLGRGVGRRVGWWFGVFGFEGDGVVGGESETFLAFASAVRLVGGRGGWRWGGRREGGTVVGERH